jgi:hypothetical protein
VSRVIRSARCCAGGGVAARQPLPGSRNAGQRDVPTIHFIDVFGNEIQDDMEVVLA